MKREINISFKSLVPLAFLGIAFYCIHLGVDGWGWAFIASLVTHGMNMNENN